MVRHRAMLRRLGADVVQFNLSTGSSCQWAMLAACTVPGIRRVALEHSSMGVWSATSARLKRLVERGLHAHVAVGERTARLLEESSRLPTGTIRTIHHGVPAVGHHPVDRGPEPTVLNVARHDPVKGVDVLLAAFALVPPPARLVLIGDGPETEALRQQCRDLALSDRVEFRGPSWDGVMAADVMWAFDLYVLPSRLEGFPATIVEAMLAGVPIVATDVGSVREQLRDGETGWIVVPEDPAALAHAITSALADRDLAAGVAAAARADAEQRFTIQATVSAWCDLYRQLLG
jgi:glycosyltransferase involved in cell wall biosynthesis